MQKNNVLIPREPPDDLPGEETQNREFDEVLFDLCRNDDYKGLYREFVRRYGKS